MDQATYDRWWQLHLRVANGEGLDSTERATYEAGLAVLDTEERAQFDDASLTVLRNLKAEVDSLEATHAKLQARSTRLDRQIGTLEGAYMMLTGFSLGGQGHATSPI